MTGRGTGGMRAGSLLAAGLLILGAKLRLIAAYGSALPWWDQWACHGITYLQRLGGRIPLTPEQAACVEPSLTLRALLAPHCEHRLVFTRLLALLLLALNGQWDARLELAVNAVFHTLTGLALAAMLWAASGRRGWTPLLALCALVCALPFSWEATLWSACISHYALLACALAALWLLLERPALSSGWWLGLGAALLGLGTMASGWLAPAAVLGVAALRWRGGDPGARRAAAGLLLAGLATLVPGLLLVVSVPGHAAIQAHGLVDLLAAAAARLAWPNSDTPWLALVAWLPLAGLLIRALLHRGPTPPGDWFLLGLGAWLILQAVAMAYGRQGAGIASRHAVILAVAIPLNAACALALWPASPLPRRRQALGAGLLALWLLPFLPGIWSLSQDALRLEAPRHGRQLAASEANVRAFIATDDIACLRGKPPFEVPYPDPESLAALLRSPEIRGILPEVVRPGAAPGPGSRAAAWLVARGTGVFLAGMLLAAGLALAAAVRLFFRCAASGPCATLRP